VETEFAPEQLLRRLADAGVELCVVGAYALAVHGYSRGAADVDIVVATSIENLRRLAAALADLGASDEPGGPPAALDAARLGTGERKLYTRLGPVHVISEVEGVPRYRTLAARAVEVDVEGEGILFCSRSDLIAMKRAAGLLLDLADLERLEAT
jgi:hypothetical protein